MSFSHTITSSVSSANGTVEAKNSFTGSLEVNVDEAIAVGVDTLIVASLDVSAVKSLFLLSDQDVSFETNATDHTGGNIIALKANIPYVWHTNAYASFLLTLDVTAIYITNASGSSANIKLRAVVDATP